MAYTGGSYYGAIAPTDLAWCGTDLEWLDLAGIGLVMALALVVLVVVLCWWCVRCV